jgi:hypothetical protein
MAAVEDEDTQINGLVGVVYGANKCQVLEYCNPHEAQHSIKLRNALPARYVSMHYCYTRSDFYDFVNFERYHFDKSLRARCRTHECFAMECQYKLASFGIPLNMIPISITGKVKTNSHDKWMESRKEKEDPVSSRLPPEVVSDASVSPEQLSNSLECDFSNISGSVQPTGNDVLFGRGKTKGHPGNIWLRKIIDQNRSRYKIAEKWEKTVIAEDIVTIVREFSGRFLKVDGNGWTGSRQCNSSGKG